jgi:hypothetical protein
MSNKNRHREYGKQDFKKVAPKELEKLGYSRTAERYIPPKNFDILLLDKKALAEYQRTGTISKRKQAQIVFGLTNEEKARKIKAGERPILLNAPKKARQGKIVKSFERRDELSYKKAIRRRLTDPINIKGFKKSGTLRYDYFLGHSIDAVSRGVLDELIKRHSPDSTARIVVQMRDEARTSESFLMRRAAEMVPEFIEELEEEYPFLKQMTDENGIVHRPDYYLYIYEPK